MALEGDNMMGVKRNNRSAALRILHQKGSMSRKRLAEQLRLTPAAITKIVGEMLGEGLLAEGETVSSGNAGRREIMLQINSRSACALGVLINLRQAIVSAVWLDGTAIFSEEIPLVSRAPADETVEMLAARLLQLAEENGLKREQMVGLGIAVRGITAADGRSVVNSFGALDRENLPLCRRFEELTKLPCVLVNNVRALLAAQIFLSREENMDSQFFLRCEYGIGAALSVGGKIWPGHTQQCAEIGHIPVIRRGGKLCSCGKSGCLETIASPAAIREDALAALSEEDTPVLWKQALEKGKDNLDIDDVLNAAMAGDAGAARIVDQAVLALGSALKSVIYLIDPGKIIFYGRMFNHPYFLSRLLAEMKEGVDSGHSPIIEKSRYNHSLEDRAASLLAVEDFFARGGSK